MKSMLFFPSICARIWICPESMFNFQTLQSMEMYILSWRRLENLRYRDQSRIPNYLFSLTHIKVPLSKKRGCQMKKMVDCFVGWCLLKWFAWPVGSWFLTRASCTCAKAEGSKLSDGRGWKDCLHTPQKHKNEALLIGLTGHMVNIYVSKRGGKRR